MYYQISIYLRFDESIIFPLDHDELLQLRQVCCEGGVVRGLLVVEGGEVSGHPAVEGQLQGVVPVLGRGDQVCRDNSVGIRQGRHVSGV